MRIFVAGATGVIGRRAVPQLISAGHQVTAVARTAAKRAQVSELGARAIELDIFDREATRRAVDGHDVVINLATHIPGSSVRMLFRSSWRENDHIRREGSRSLVDAALAAGVSRFIQESFALIYADQGDRWIDELSPTAPVPYNRTTLDAERNAERFTAAGGDAVVLRFAGLYGPDPLTRSMIGIVEKGWSPLPGRAGAYFSPLEQDDAATAVVAALGAPAGTYNVADDNPLPRRDFVDALAAVLGVRPPRFLPAWTAYLMGEMGRFASRSERISNRAFRRVSGWAPKYPSVREGWPAVVDALRLSHPRPPASRAA